ncbi:MAG: phosphoribosylformylglycinamidine cyclo-ligase [Chloroflexota bacterium]
MNLTYKSAGVDIEAGEETVDRIKPLVRSTFNANVLSEIGLFGGLYDAKFPEYEHPVLVASADGVGTKLKIAFMAGKHDTVGQCLVNHCVNDILACGAKPLFFLDYFATGKLEPSVAEQVIGGFAKACAENGCALIGGETAEMPGFYNEGEYDMSGTIVGVVEKSKVLNGSRVKKGDVLVALPSTGLHTNGYSLARAVLFPKYSASDRIDSLGATLGEALLAVHRSYYPVIKPLLDADLINALSHVTGGGIIGNTKRIIPKGCVLDIDWNSWQAPEIFQLIRREGKLGDEEMRRAFNLGAGLIAVVSPDNLDEVLRLLEPEKPWVIGQVN